jgi:hypothetical protein
MILTKRDISRHFIKIPQSTTLHKIFKRESSYCMRTDGKTDRQTHDALIAAFSDFSNLPKTSIEINVS